MSADFDGRATAMLAALPNFREEINARPVLWVGMDVGDKFTMWVQPRESWWRRVLICLGLAARAKPRLTTYEVKATATSPR